MIASSIGSLSSSLEARAAYSMTSFSVYFLKTFTSPTVSSFFVIVPVLSAHRMSTPAISSMATSLLTMASFFASADAPTVMQTERTAGMAAGIAATIRTSPNWMISRGGC